MGDENFTCAISLFYLMLTPLSFIIEFLSKLPIHEDESCMCVNTESDHG